MQTSAGTCFDSFKCCKGLQTPKAHSALSGMKDLPRLTVSLPFSREAFAAWLFQGGVPLSYAIAIGYVCVDTVDKAYKAYSQTGQKLAADTELSPLVDQAKWAALHPAIPKTGCAKGKSAMKAVTLDSARGWLPRVTHLLLLQSPTWCLCAG
jgi:hypothetical protein